MKNFQILELKVYLSSDACCERADRVFSSNYRITVPCGCGRKKFRSCFYLSGQSPYFSLVPSVSNSIVSVELEGLKCLKISELNIVVLFESAPR